MMEPSATKILIIEDNPLDVRMVDEYLMDYRSFNFYLTSSETLAEGLIELEKNNYDVILLDLNLPDSFGIDTFEKISKVHHNIPIILLTGVQDELIATEAIKNGAQDYLVKNQINDALLVRSIKYAIERKGLERALTAAKEKAEESDRLKSAFLANMSHEIRTPMNGLLGFAELLKEPLISGEEQQNYLSMIEKSGERLLNIINNLINISKIESGQMTLSFSMANINEIMRYVYNFFRLEAERKDIKLKLIEDKDSQNIILRTDQEKLISVLTNLIKNAIKYSLKGSIEFGFYQKNEKLNFFVKDSGIGIPKNKLEGIFNRFERIEDSMPSCVEGSGLGLPISKAYIELMKGQIWAESEAEQGSTFYFTLPFNSKNKFKINETKSIIKKDPEKVQKDLNIMIVEDDEVSQRYLKTILQKHYKEIIIKSNGMEAVNECRNNTAIDLILMDIQIPIIDGYEATQKIREFNKSVIIIAQTAFAISGDRKKALDAGCNDYISKPVDKNKLAQLIHKYFN